MEKSLGIHDAEDLMDLAVNVKRLGMDMPAQCAEGFRILGNMKKSDVNENQFESFNLRFISKVLLSMCPLTVFTKFFLCNKIHTTHFTLIRTRNLGWHDLYALTFYL